MSTLCAIGETCIRRTGVGLLVFLVGLAFVFENSVQAETGKVTLHGGIEIGSKGVKAMVIRMTRRPGGYDVKVLDRGSENPGLVADLQARGRFDDKALKKAAQAVRQFHNMMRNKHKVPAANIHVVGSSGLFSALKGDADKIARNKQLLSATVRKAINKKMDFIDVNREVELLVIGIIPPNHAGQSLLLDVGSGNTKGGFRGKGNRLVLLDLPYGTVTFADRVKSEKSKLPFPEKASALSKKLLQPALARQRQSNPELAQRKRIYLSGGVVWALATYTHPEVRASFTPLTTDDLKEFRTLLVKNLAALPDRDLSHIRDKQAHKQAAGDLRLIRKIFKPKELLAGTEVLLALSKELNLGSKDKNMYFARHGYLGWILAYTVERARK